MLIKTGISVAVPNGTYGRIAPRSGLALKNGIDVMAGVIDADYRGDVGVILVNLGSSPFTINPGDRIAQLILEKIEYNTSVQEIGEADDLSPTSRGANGFGSTGVAKEA
jgi:dUTP pyrophosphatase